MKGKYYFFSNCTHSQVKQSRDPTCLCCNVLHLDCWSACSKLSVLICPACQICHHITSATHPHLEERAGEQKKREIVSKGEWERGKGWDLRLKSEKDLLKSNKVKPRTNTPTHKKKSLQMWWMVFQKLMFSCLFEQLIKLSIHRCDFCCPS